MEIVGSFIFKLLTIKNLKYADKYRVQDNKHPCSHNSDLSNLNILPSLLIYSICVSLHPFTYFLRSDLYHDSGFKNMLGASLVAQWLRICLPMQGTRVRALVWEDPTCRGATRPVSHNY